jgi:general secretion pathway protein J
MCEVKNKHRYIRHDLGFTLIEVLVALAILASLTVAAFQVLNQVQLSNEVSQDKETRLGEIQKALAIMDSDFRQMAARQFRIRGETSGKQFIYMKDRLLSSETEGILFTRLGWLNPQMQFPRGEIVKVGYRVVDERLERVWWRYPDTVAGDTGNVRPLLTKVEALSFRFFYKNNWIESWDNNGVLPEAVDIKLKLKDYGDIERIYLTSGIN